MSPEQAKGFEADQRSDIFSFGCILYELLTGRAAFDGDTASEILASVLKTEVDLTALPARLNPRLVEVLRRCLEKNPKKRWHAAADVRVEIESAIDRPVVADEARPAGVAQRPLWRRASALAAAAIVGAALAGYAAWSLKPPPATSVARFRIALADGEVFTNTARRFVDFSPDGTKLTYVANQRIYVRELNALESRLLAGVENAPLSNPTFSPDGQSIVYGVAGSTGPPVLIKRVALGGGAAVRVCEVESVTGLRWDEHGIVIGQGAREIVRVSPDGGTPEVIVAAGADEFLGSPQILPGGRTVLYTVKKASENWETGQIVVQPLGGGERKVLVAGGSDGRYLPTGHLVYTLSGVLLGVRFDVNQLAVVGGPVPLVEGVRRSISPNASGSAQVGISDTGALVYAPGPVSSAGPGNDLALFDRKGESQRLNLPTGITYHAPRVSPDGRFVAFESDDSKEAVVWVYELSGSSARRRLTFGGNNRAPAWSPDGQWIAFQSDREGDVAVFRQRADGSGAAAERLTKPDKGAQHIPQDWSPDGERLLVTVRQDQQFVLTTLTLKDRKLEPFADARSPVMVNAAFSPDGRWIAYQGRSPGNVVYVQPFPSTGAKYLLPQPGAGHPTWSPKGDEILVNWALQRSAIITVKTTPNFAFGQPADFPRAGRGEPSPATDRTNIDFLPDGQRIVGVTAIGQPGVTADEFVVVLNWFEELKQRLQN